MTKLNHKHFKRLTERMDWWRESLRVWSLRGLLIGATVLLLAYGVGNDFISYKLTLRFAEGWGKFQQVCTFAGLLTFVAIFMIRRKNEK